MCSAPHPLAKKVFNETLELNIGDPGLVPGLIEVEQEAVGVMAGYCGLPGAPGRIVTGGTEANILAMWTALQKAGHQKREVVLPVSRHFSFDKAANLLELELKFVDLDEKGEMDVAMARSLVGPRTMALVGLAGSTGLGAVDPLEELSSLAVEKDLYLHVDASFGGFVLPFLEEAGYPTRRFDFSLPGVSSIAIDPHKMGRGPIPSGCILYRSRDLYNLTALPVTYLSGGRTLINTVVGTRSGAAVAAVWAILKHLDRRGYVRIVKEAMELTHWLQGEIEKLEGYTLQRIPEMNIIGLKPLNMSSAVLEKKLRDRGWALSLWDTYLRIVLMPHVKKSHLKRFLKDLVLVAREAK